jgi:hypothetical protein
LRGKLCILAALLAVLTLMLIFQVKAADFTWKDDFHYANLQEMQNAGWVLENPSGTRLESNGVVIDGTKADTVIRYRNHFPSGIYDWSVETKSMWLGVGHSGPGLNVVTEKHSYGIVADGWYNHFAFARDDKQVTFGSYEEQANVWVTMTITKKGDAVNVYCNGVSIYSYTEVDTASSKLIGVERIAPWRGVMLYDYYQVAGPDAISATTADSRGFPIFYVAVGGGIAVIAVVGAAVYFFFIAGGGAGATAAAGAAGVLAGGAAGTAGGALGGAEGAIAGGVIGAGTASAYSDVFESVMSNLFFETVTNIMSDLGYDCSNLVTPDIFGQPTSEILRGGASGEDTFASDVLEILNKPTGPIEDVFHTVSDTITNIFVKDPPIKGDFMTPVNTAWGDSLQVTPTGLKPSVQPMPPEPSQSGQTQTSSSNTESGTSSETTENADDF